MYTVPSARASAAGRNPLFTAAPRPAADSRFEGLIGPLEWLPESIDARLFLYVGITALITGVYTISGGLTAVVYTDVVNGILMIIGCLGVLVLGLVELGGPVEFWNQLEPAQKALVLPVDTDTPFPWTGILFGLALILSPAYWIGNQAIVQRSLGAKSAFQAQAAYVWGALLKCLIPVIIVGPGLVAVLLYPDLDQADHAFPQLVAGLLPPGLRGIFLAAFLAAFFNT